MLHKLNEILSLTEMAEPLPVATTTTKEFYDKTRGKLAEIDKTVKKEQPAIRKSFGRVSSMIDQLDNALEAAQAEMAGKKSMDPWRDVKKPRAMTRKIRPIKRPEPEADQGGYLSQFMKFFG